LNIKKQGPTSLLMKKKKRQRQKTKEQFINIRFFKDRDTSKI